MLQVERTPVARVVHLEREQNLFDEAFLTAFHRALDEIEAEQSGAPVVTVGSGKFFSNGFDLEHLGGLDGSGAIEFVDRSCALLARVLTFPAPTVAAVNGHAFGIGAMLALAHDQRVMREDRGWFCLPEVDLGLPFRPFMQALVTARLAPPVAQEAMLTGRRYDAVAALAAGIVDATAPDGELIDQSIERTAAWAGKQPAVLGALKAQLHAAIVAHVTPPTPSPHPAL
jgi:enoyl-CoA hydratase/carnithine racemase